MMAIKGSAEAIGKVAEALKATPLALPLVVVNALALVLVAYVLHEISDRATARDALITDLAKNCHVMPK